MIKYSILALVIDPWLQAEALSAKVCVFVSVLASYQFIVCCAGICGGSAEREYTSW